LFVPDRGAIKRLPAIDRARRPVVRGGPFIILTRSRHSRNLDIVHEADGNLRFAFERGPRAAGGQREDFPGPQGRNEPFDNVTLRVAMAYDVSLTIHFVSLSSDDFAGNGDIGVGETDAVEFQLERAFTDKVSGLLLRLKVSAEIAAPGKNILSEFPKGAQVADDRVTNIGRG
jgi:hypothetical protein